MKQEAFKDVFTTEFKNFTSRKWLDYCDETQGPFSNTEDYAGYVINNFKYLIRKYNDQYGQSHLNEK